MGLSPLPSGRGLRPQLMKFDGFNVSNQKQKDEDGNEKIVRVLTIMFGDQFIIPGNKKLMCKPVHAAFAAGMSPEQFSETLEKLAGYIRENVNDDGPKIKLAVDNG